MNQSKMIIIGCLILLTILIVLTTMIPRSITKTSLPSGSTTDPSIPITQTTVNNPGYTEEIKKSEEKMKNIRPDIFVLNRTPYETSSFTVVSYFKVSKPTGHYYFIVQAKKQATEEQLRSLMTNWLQSLGLTSTQINVLDIVYQAAPRGE